MQRAQRVTPLGAAVLALAVVLGILAMHAVSGGPHTPRGVDHAMAGPASMLIGSASAMSGMTADIGQDVQGALVAAAVSAPPGPTDLAGGMAAMCAVVLLVLVLVLGFGLLGRSWPQSARPGAAALVPGCRYISRAPPRDLLAELCVLRT